MSASSGPYSNPGVTGATTGPYLGAEEVRGAVSAARVDVRYRNFTDPDTTAVLLAELDQLRAALAAAATPAPPVDLAQPDVEDRYGETYAWHQFPGCQPGYHQCVDGESIDYIERERGGKLRPAVRAARGMGATTTEEETSHG